MRMDVNPQPPSPTFLLLNSQLGWPTSTSESVSVGVTLRLKATPGGPQSLTSPAGSLGGLTLPRGLAVPGAGEIYLLCPRPQPMIKRFDSATGLFAPLPGVGGAGEEERQLRQPLNIAIGGRDLYVADTGNRRVQVFALGSLALRHVWLLPRRPVDVAAQSEWAYVLTSDGRVFRHPVGGDTLAELHLEPAGQAARRWSRIALDRAGHIYLFNRRAGVLDEFAADGRWVGQYRAADSIRERFAPPPIRVFFDQRSAGHGPGRAFFRVPDSLRGPCAPQAEAHTSTEVVFDACGNQARIDLAEVIEPRSHEPSGTWISTALDSQLFQCQWHRVELELDDLPPGAQVIVSSYAADDNTGSPPASSALWDRAYTAVGPMQPPDADGADATPSTDQHEFLIQSRPGQLLWLKLELRGDGYGSPAVRALRVHFPRESYLQYLPAIYASDNETQWFLQRFLSIFQTEWDALEQRIATLSRYYDPDTVPGTGGWIERLADLMALPLEGGWTPEQKRNLLRAAPRGPGSRGTPDGLRAYLRAYLQNIADLSPEEQGSYPLLVEGFHERQRLMLEQGAQDGPGQTALWGPAAVGRLQLGVFARASEARLVGPGAPQDDLFREHAHRFRVYVPAAWLRTAADERMLRRAVEAEKPAYAAYELCLVEPRLRVGVQSTVGIDTIVGGYPMARLARPNTDAPPSRPPRNRLGYDTILGTRPTDPPQLHLRPVVRVGTDTRLN